MACYKENTPGEQAWAEELQKVRTADAAVMSHLWGHALLTPDGSATTLCTNLTRYTVKEPSVRLTSNSTVVH